MVPSPYNPYPPASVVSIHLRVNPLISSFSPRQLSLTFIQYQEGSKTHSGTILISLTFDPTDLGRFYLTVYLGGVGCNSFSEGTYRGG